jgi:uncharacterized protein (TIGR03118 family)
MRTRQFMKNTSVTAVILLSLTLAHRALAANQYVQHNLVSDIPGVADQTDPNLTNPWGISMSASSPFWISNNHSGNATLYDGQGHAVPPASPIVVQIPLPAGGTSPAAPTGQVFNDTQAFVISGTPAVFIFATEDGTISGWNPAIDPRNAILLVDQSASGAVYKGLALATTDSGPMLYAANFNRGTIDVFDGNLSPVSNPGAFTDTNLPAGFAPFNVQRIGRRLYVTFAMQDDAKHDDVAGAGNGFVDIFDFNGRLQGRLISNGPLNSPWGMALAPANFGDFSNTLLVGNFGDGLINSFDSCSGQYLGPLRDSTGATITITGLWALTFGNGRSGGDANTLYFTAGIPGPDEVEDHGLFGNIQAMDPTSASDPATTSAAQPFVVNIANFAFSPAGITVPAGTQIQWTNQDNTAHTVTADNSGFKSGALDQNQMFSQTLAQPGTYPYHCSIHPFMKGQIIVK